MLEVEGINKQGMMHNEYETFVLDEDGVIKGFFTIKEEHGFPSLQHLVIDRKYRSPSIAREIHKMLRAMIKIKGFKKAIVHAKKEYQRTIIEYCFKVKPYSIEKNKTAWYLVEV